MRVVKRKIIFLVLCSMAFLFVGCKQEVQVQKIETYAPVAEYKIGGKKGEQEELCFQFIRENMMKNGGIYTGYLDTDKEEELATGHEILAESEGLMLRYAVQSEDKALYEEIKDYIIGTLAQDNYLSYRIDKTGKPMKVNACVDDLRIIRGLFEGGDKQLALAYAEQLKKTNLKEGVLVDYYSAKENVSGNDLTLCYGDLIAMDYIVGDKKEWKAIRKQTEQIMLGGYLGDTFPFFQTRYHVKKQNYTTDTVFMVESLLTAYHLAEVGKCPQTTIDWLEKELNNGVIYGRYTIDGAVAEKVESTAIYAICVLLGKQTGNERIKELAFKKLNELQVMEKESEVYGAFADSTTLSVYSFDNLMSLLAFRTTAIPTEQQVEEEKIIDTILICKETERSMLEQIIKNCGKEVAFIKEIEATDEVVKPYSYVVTTSEIVAHSVSDKKKIFCIGEAKPKQLTEELSYQDTAYVTFSMDDLKQTGKKREQLIYIEQSMKGHPYGIMEFMPNKKVPYSIVGKDFGYASYIEEKDLSTIALTRAFQDFFDLPKKEGKFYVMLDNVYPFTNEKMLIKMGEDLYANGIPYIIRVMPVYHNLDYPAFEKWTNRLSYLQAKNGTVVLSNPIHTNGTDSDENELPLKLMRAENALKTGGIFLYPMETTPICLDLAFLKEVKGKTRNFEPLKVDTVLTLPVYESEKEWEKGLEVLKEKWLTVSDYRLNYTNELPVYKENELTKDYEYREKTEVSMERFFNKSNQILLFIVCIAVVLFSIMLIGSRIIYKNKFRKD